MGTWGYEVLQLQAAIVPLCHCAYCVLTARREPLHCARSMHAAQRTSSQMADRPEALQRSPRTSSMRATSHKSLQPPCSARPRTCGGRAGAALDRRIALQHAAADAGLAALADKHRAPCVGLERTLW